MRRVLALLALSALFPVLAACSEPSDPAPMSLEEPGFGTWPHASALFVLTDRPVDNLSVFQVELTGIAIRPVGGTPRTVLPMSPVPVFTLVVNLLNPQAVSRILGWAMLSPLYYDQISLSYVNATAMDNAANTLTVLPQTSGTVTIDFSPVLLRGDSWSFFQTDFDVAASVSNIVPGPGGSLTLNPTISVTRQPPALLVHEYKGMVESVTANFMKISSYVGGLSTGTILVHTVYITPSTSVVKSGATSVGVTNLASLIAAGDLVKVNGSLTTAFFPITATAIQVQDNGDDFQNDRYLDGIVTSISPEGFDVRVQWGGNSAIAPGTSQTVGLSGTTGWSYEYLHTAATAENLTVGQAVRVTGTPTSALDARRVSLSETRLSGTVTAVNAVANQVTVTVTRIGRMDAEALAGFSNPVTLQYPGTLPASVVPNSAVEVQGAFNRTASGVFDVHAE
jgi:hypothetical protein